MSYLHEDGDDDTLDDSLLWGRCMAVALGKLMTPGQSIEIELPFQPSCPNDPYGHYLVECKDKLITLRKVSDDGYYGRI